MTLPTPADPIRVLVDAAPVQILLGPGRVVEFRRAASSDRELIYAWQAEHHSVTPGSHALIAGVAGLLASRDPDLDLDGHALLLLFDPGGQLSGVAAYRSTGEGRAGAVFEVAGGYRNLGLGTFLLRRAAELAVGQGIDRFVVDLVPDAGLLLDMLRDCGLRLWWDLGYPLTSVELELGEQRPGWATPECQTAPAGQVSQSVSVR